MTDIVWGKNFNSLESAREHIMLQYLGEYWTPAPKEIPFIFSAAWGSWVVWFDEVRAPSTRGPRTIRYGYKPAGLIIEQGVVRLRKGGFWFPLYVSDSTLCYDGKGRDQKALYPRGKLVVEVTSSPVSGNVFSFSKEDVERAYNVALLRTRFAENAMERWSAAKDLKEASARKDSLRYWNIRNFLPYI